MHILHGLHRFNPNCLKDIEQSHVLLGMQTLYHGLGIVDHVSVFIDFLEGRTAFFENGQKLFEKTGVKVGPAVCKEV